MKKLIVILFAAASACAPVQADTAYSFTYQAALRNAMGDVITNSQGVVRNHEVNIRLWDAAENGTLLWGKTYSILTDETGLFNLEVGDSVGSALQGALYNSLEDVFVAKSAGGVWIGLEVKGSAGEIAPRQRLFAVPFAAVANDVRSISKDVKVGGALRLEGLTISKEGISQSEGHNELGELAVSGKLSANGGVEVNGSEINVNTTLNVKGENSKVTVGGTDLIGVPVGGIIMWTKPELPDNEHWAVCDGSTEGVPDLRSRFIVGASASEVTGRNSYSLGASRDRDEITISEEQLPSHSHTYVGDDQIEGIDNGMPTQVRQTSINYDADSSVNSSRGKSKVYRTSTTGSGSKIDIRPSYYALYFIMRIK